MGNTDSSQKYIAFKMAMFMSSLFIMGNNFRKVIKIYSDRGLYKQGKRKKGFSKSVIIGI
jgi:hypothetical protein